jgi:Protein of unknown function (DUF3565)
MHDEAPGAILDMMQGIVGYDQDDAQHWVAILACGHRQHLRHQPPWTNRPCVTTAEGRESRLGAMLDCPLCDQDPLPDWQG